MAPGATSTIRVARQTRDLLAKQARVEGVSLASLLARLALERQNASILRSEQAASRIDAEQPGRRDEDRDWDTALPDGID
jgi:hypothetical protein